LVLSNQYLFSSESGSGRVVTSILPSFPSLSLHSCFSHITFWFPALFNECHNLYHKGLEITFIPRFLSTYRDEISALKNFQNVSIMSIMQKVLELQNVPELPRMMCKKRYRLNFQPRIFDKK
jgi:hypothetical protein